MSDLLSIQTLLFDVGLVLYPEVT